MRHPAKHPLAPPQESKRFRFGMRSLLMMMVIVGPAALVVSNLPKIYLLAQGGILLVVISLVLVAWCASFARPRNLAFCLLALSLTSVVLAISLTADTTLGFARLLAITGISVWGSLASGCALGISLSRHAR